MHDPRCGDRGAAATNSRVVGIYQLGPVEAVSGVLRGSGARGEASQIKETTIAVAVFQRAADYDPIVRVHARRVRERLDLYYRTTGTHDPITINLPKGGYVPSMLRALPKRKTEFTDWEEAQQPKLVRREPISLGLARSLLRPANLSAEWLWAPCCWGWRCWDSPQHGCGGGSRQPDRPRWERSSRWTQCRPASFPTRRALRTARGWPSRQLLVAT